jgi:hypothetical protein
MLVMAQGVIIVLHVLITKLDKKPMQSIIQASLERANMGVVGAKEQIIIIHLIVSGEAHFGTYPLFFNTLIKRTG